MTTTLPVYDSAQPRTTPLTVFKNLWSYRGLLRLLVRRELTVRYKRSTLGIWWTLLNPLLTTGVLWLVFGLIAGRFGNQDLVEPYVVYLLAGVIMMTFFSQTVLATGSAITGSKDILSKVYVPAEVFAFATAFAGLVNFLISASLLVIATIASGQGIAVTAWLTPVPILSMLALVTGLGLLIASAAVWFFDVLDLTRVLVQLLYYLTPVFWTLSFIPEWAHGFVFSNPLYSYLEVFRDVTYRGVVSPAWQWTMMLGTALAAISLGTWVFTRAWKSLVNRL